jgi:hypothetical protein
MGLLTIEAFIVTDSPVTAYGGFKIDTSVIPSIAEQIRRGGLPMLGNHDERLRLKPRLLDVDVRRTRSGALGVWVEFEIDEEAWKAAEEAMGGVRGFSISVIEAYMETQGGASKPVLELASDAGHWDDYLRDEVAAALTPHFNVKSSRLYQFDLVPPAKVLIDFGVPLLQLIQSVGINVFSSALWDGLKLFFAARPSAMTTIVFSAPRSDGQVHFYLNTPDPEVAKQALDKLPEIANSPASVLHYDEEQERWDEDRF